MADFFTMSHSGSCITTAAVTNLSLNNMNYTEKTKRVEEIIAEINSGTTDPSAIIAKIEEAKRLIAECQAELTNLEKNLDKEAQ